MADSADTAAGNEPGDQAPTRPKRRSTRKVTRKTTGKTPAKKTTAKKSTAKKTAPKKTTAKRSTAKKATGQTTPQVESAEVPASAVLAADFDRSQLSEKMRVHALAKLLGMTSRDLILALDEIGMVKVAQSTLSLAESGQLLDALGRPAEQAPGTPDAEPVEKIRQRVEKNVANEIHQIEEKVERELADASPESGAETAEETPEPDVAGTEHPAVASEELEEPELLADVTPEITPPPAEEPAFQVPIFRAPSTGDPVSTDAGPDTGDGGDTEDHTTESNASRRRRRGRRGGGRGRGAEEAPQDVASTETPETPETPHSAVADLAETREEPDSDEPVALKGSTRLEAQRRRRSEMREEGRRKRQIVSQAEFLARRESVDRTMVVRERHRHDHAGMVTQVGVLEDELLVEHFVTSEEQSSLIGNIYLGRVQNVLPSMEAAFIDIGKGRNGVLYAGEVNWKAAGLGGRSRRIEQALRSGDQVLVQVTKDPVGHKGARLTTQISLAGRFLVYVPGGRSAGISRKLPAPERKRLKEILKAVVPGEGGAIIRTAAEGVSEQAIGEDVSRLHRLWEDIQERTEQEKRAKGAKPVTMYEEPNMLVKVIRDLFNEDFNQLVVDGDKAWNMVHAYVKSVAPDLLDRVQKYNRKTADDLDAFAYYRVDEQLQKALSRKVWLPSGGSLVIDRTEAMTVIDVNTGKFTGSGGNLEETVTRNNLEAAEEVVRQLRLRDIGGMIVVDFIDMVLPENRDLVLRRLTESLGRDRTRHQVSEVTSLGLVQMTRKRLGTGLLETFSTECEHCAGRGLILHDDPVEQPDERPVYSRHAKKRSERPASTPPTTAPDTGSAPVAEPASPSIEDLAASVVIGDPVEESETTGGSRASRRGSRGRGRGRRRSESPQHAEVVTERRVPVEAAADSDLEQIVAAAVDRADLEDPEEPSGAEYAPPQVPVEPESPAEKSTAAPAESTGDYDRAVAEFEASPRRKRRTRGNSRSDHRPRPEDFPADGTTGGTRTRRQQSGRKRKPETPPPAVARPTERPVEQPTGQVAATTATPAGRRRRRAVRRTMSQPAAAPTAVEPSKPDSPQPERGGEERDVVKRPKTSGRGRRRVVRKGAGAPTRAQDQPEAEQKPEQAGRTNPPKSNQSRQGSGRRRSGRRSTRG